MLTREDIDNLFDLLAIYRKNDPHLSEKGLRAAWLLVLAPYERDDVRRAVGAWFRTSKYWPDVSEIAAFCPPLPPEKERRKTPPQTISEDWTDWRQTRERWNKLVALRREAGLPATVSEAKKAGMPDGEWLDLLAERGLAWM